MDGNGRWAELRGENRTKGHEKGAEVVRDITTYCANHKDIEQLTLYAFSTENWKRPKLEVAFLMKLLESWLKKELPLYLKNDVKFMPIGDLSKFSSSLQKTISKIQEKTAHCKKLTQTLALNYGARDELVRAINTLNNASMPISEKSISHALDCENDVDLLIRTGGDHRLSNFLLWQASYAELFFSDTLWPNFTIDEMSTIIEKFSSIERRFGALK